MSKHSARGPEWERLRALVYRVHGRVCVYCGAYADTVDHVDPVSISGEALPSLDKLVPACRRCNSIKGNKVKKRCNYVNQTWLKAL